MIIAIKQNLQRGINLLEVLTDEEYTDRSIAPYHSCIGSHVRHVLDIFNCVFNGLDNKSIDLTLRNRDSIAQNFTNEGIKYIHLIISKLDTLDLNNLNEIVMVTDELGLGKETVPYTLSGILMQAHSHAIHHFASIGYIISGLGIELPDADFGYNPSTPKRVFADK